MLKTRKCPLLLESFDNITSIWLIIISIMRRTPYTEKIDRPIYQKGTSRGRNVEINPQSFKLEVNRITEDNYVSPKTPFPYYHPRTVKPMLHRPFTTQKTHSFLEYKSTIRSTKDRVTIITCVEQSWENNWLWVHWESHKLIKKSMLATKNISNFSTQRADFTEVVLSSKIKGWWKS